ncbi:MAG: FkbM family methyltransferase, partial [bacterium]
MGFVKEILRDFEKKGINYCILRNYNHLDSDKEVDILINDKKKVISLLMKQGFKVGANYGNYLTMKKKGFWFDFKVGGLVYQGFLYKSADKLLKTKIKKKGFWTLSPLEEVIHLLLHCIIDKGFFKEEYKKQIESLLNVVNKKDLFNELYKNLSNNGKKLYCYLMEKNYHSMIGLRGKLLQKLFSLKQIIPISILVGIKTRNKIIKSIDYLSWIVYRYQIKSHKKNKEKLDLNLKKIGIPKSFTFYTLKEDNGLSKELDIFGFREPLNWKNYYYFIDKNDIVLDIGANLGMFSLLSFNAKKIISVEPIKKCIPILKRNLEVNGLKNKSEIVNMAVGSRGKAYIRKHSRFNLSSIVDKDYIGPK